MKLKILLLLSLFVVTALASNAQDIITTMDDTSFAAKVLEIDKQIVKYKKFNNLEGPTYSLPVKEIKVITYENGTKEVFNKTPAVRMDSTSPTSFPNVSIKLGGGTQTQNSRTNQSVSDSRLLAMDDGLLDMSNSYKYEKRARNCKLIGWIGAGLLVGSEIYFFTATDEWGDNYPVEGGILTGAGVIWGASFLIAAHRNTNKAKEIRRVSFAENTILQYGNHKLNASIDLLGDRANTALGIGVSYTF